MTDAKFTAGPWRADVSDPSDVVIWAGEGEFLANIGQRIQNVSVAFDCDVHNAHLIAAAPEMYAALEMAEQIYQTGIFDAPEGLLQKAVDARYAAMRKARGEA